MCYLRLTRYTCEHTSSIHPPGYTRPYPINDATQSHPLTEMPTHKDSGVLGCQDAGRRGARCPEELAELDVTFVEKEDVCDECKRPNGV